MGLGAEVAFPWQTLLLLGASWILARILIQIYAAYRNYRRLHVFPQPPKWNWLMGHVGMVRMVSGWVGVSEHTDFRGIRNGTQSDGAR